MNHITESVRYLAVKSGEDITVSLLTDKRLQPRKDSSVYHHSLNCKCSSSFESFSVLYHENKKYFIELKESPFIMRDRPSMKHKKHTIRSSLFELHGLNEFLLHYLTSQLFYVTF